MLYNNDIIEILIADFLCSVYICTLYMSAPPYIYDTERLGCQDNLIMP